MADISGLIKHCKSVDISLDLTEYELSQDELNKYKEVLDLSLNEYSKNSHMLECYSLFGRNNVNDFIRIDNDIGYDILVTREDTNDTPVFYFGRNIGNKIMKHDDFSYLIKIPEDVNEELVVIYSSTDYKSFAGRREEERILTEWVKNNLNDLKKSWDRINEIH